LVVDDVAAAPAGMTESRIAMSGSTNAANREDITVNL